MWTEPLIGWFSQGVKYSATLVINVIVALGEISVDQIIFTTPYASVHWKTDTTTFLQLKKFLILTKTFLQSGRFAKGPIDLAPCQVIQKWFYMLDAIHGLLFTFSQEHGLVCGGLFIIIHPIVRVTARHPNTPQSPHVSEGSLHRMYKLLVVSSIPQFHQWLPTAWPSLLADIT